MATLDEDSKEKVVEEEDDEIYRCKLKLDNWLIYYFFL